jgi:hypothetical protein
MLRGSLRRKQFGISLYNGVQTGAKKMHTNCLGTFTEDVITLPRDKFVQTT